MFPPDKIMILLVYVV